MQRILFALFKWPLPRSVERALKALFWILVLLCICEVGWFIVHLLFLKTPPYWQYILIAFALQVLLGKVVVDMVNWCQFHPYRTGIKAKYRYKTVE